MPIQNIDLINATPTDELEQALAVAEELDPNGRASTELTAVIETRPDRSESVEPIDLSELTTPELEQTLLLAYHTDPEGHTRTSAMVEYATREDGDEALVDDPIYVIGAGDDD